MIPALEQLRVLGVLRDVDLHFARATARMAGEDDARVLLALAVASRAPGAGHVCADLRDPSRIVRLEDADRGDAVAWPDPDEWIEALRGSALVAVPDAAERRPLVLDGERLYLDRYWRYQQCLVGALRARAALVRDDVDEALLQAGLDRLFPPGDGVADPDLQRAAAEMAVRRALAVVTGGPGTGKTTTVVRVLALLAEQALARGETPRIALAAPTGKAAARMAEAVQRGVAMLALPEEVRCCIPVTALTLHRLLRWQPATPTRFRHCADEPLAADVVVVDETSMVDLALMAKLVSAVRSDARLVLLGDRDQLASVEAGAILGDICPEDMDAPRDEAIGRCVVRLLHSHRFRPDGGIGAVARAINAGDADAACAACETGGEVSIVAPRGMATDLAGIREQVLEGYRDFLRADSPDEAIVALERFRVLCAHRSGRLGAAGLNETVTRWCETAGLLDRRGAGDGGWYHRRPIIVTRNDAALELYNGDVGVILTGEDGRLRAWFRAPEGGVRAVSPARLPSHETVFAMTVHKSQGSEFDRVVLVLPARPSPVLTRELLYTGVTRARRAVSILGTTDVLRAGIAERVQRASGLREKLWSAGSAGIPAPDSRQQAEEVPA